MAIAGRPNAASHMVDKQWLRAKLQENGHADAIRRQPGMSPQRVREMMMNEGIRPEDNEFSRGIIAAREE